MNKVYFEKVIGIGSLYLEKILFSFENIPIVFVCINKYDKRYLCLCDDVFDGESWILVQISNETLLKILKDENTILSAYKNRKIIVANKSFGEEITYYEEEYNKIDPDELPVSDQYLEMKDYLADYINKIKRVCYYSQLMDYKLYFSDYEQYFLTLEFSSKNYCRDYTNILEKYYKELTNVNLEFSSNLQVKYEIIELNNQNDFDKNNINISYAA